jgi:hypothetical protein
MWLRDFLPLDFPDFRILIWGYESDLKDSMATMSIASFSRQLLTAVHGAREGDENVWHDVPAFHNTSNHACRLSTVP